jgi:hypothetical protein
VASSGNGGQGETLNPKTLLKTVDSKILKSFKRNLESLKP